MQSSIIKKCAFSILMTMMSSLAFADFCQQITSNEKDLAQCREEAAKRGKADQEQQEENKRYREKYDRYVAEPATGRVTPSNGRSR